jgi:hypothetical protein
MSPVENFGTKTEISEMQWSVREQKFKFPKKSTEFTAELTTRDGLFCTHKQIYGVGKRLKELYTLKKKRMKASLSRDIPYHFFCSWLVRVHYAGHWEGGDFARRVE